MILCYFLLAFSKTHSITYGEKKYDYGTFFWKKKQ